MMLFLGWNEAANRPGLHTLCPPLFARHDRTRYLPPICLAVKGFHRQDRNAFQMAIACTVSRLVSRLVSWSSAGQARAGRMAFFSTPLRVARLNHFP